MPSPNAVRQVTTIAPTTTLLSLRSQMSDHGPGPPPALVQSQYVHPEGLSCWNLARRTTERAFRHV